MNIFLLLLFWSLWFFNFSSRTIIAPVLPIIEDELHISHTLAGGFFSSLSIGLTVSLFISGLLSPRIGYKRSIILGFMMMSAGLFGFRYAVTYQSLVVASFFMGLGAGIYMPSSIPLLTEIFDRRHWGKVLSIHDSGATFSVLAIPILSAFALRMMHWRTLFILLSGVCLFAVIIFTVCAPNPQPTEGQGGSFKTLLKRKDFWIIAVLWTFAAASGLGLYNITPLFLVKEKGFELETANTIFGISRLGGVLATFFAGVLADRFGFRKVLFIIIAATGMATMGMAISHTFPLLATILFCQATFSPSFFPVGLVAISKITTLTERSIFTGAALAIAVLVGLGLTPLTLGAIADRGTFQSGIFGLGFLTALSGFLLTGLRLNGR